MAITFPQIGHSTRLIGPPRKGRGKEMNMAQCDMYIHNSLLTFT